MQMELFLIPIFVLFRPLQYTVLVLSNSVSLDIIWTLYDMWILR
jgi:hypothetical protein